MHLKTVSDLSIRFCLNIPGKKEISLWHLQMLCRILKNLLETFGLTLRDRRMTIET